jgi:hypothetical protein
MADPDSHEATEADLLDRWLGFLLTGDLREFRELRERAAGLLAAGGNPTREGPAAEYPAVAQLAGAELSLPDAQSGLSAEELLDRAAAAYRRVGRTNDALRIGLRWAGLRLRDPRPDRAPACAGDQVGRRPPRPASR